MNLDWTTLWKKKATLEEVTEEFRKEIIYDRLSQISSTMLSQFGRPETKEYNLIMMQDNIVVVEFPLLRGMSQGDLEEVVKQLLMTYTVQTIPAVYIDQVRVDLFGYEAELERTREERRARRNAKLDEVQTVEELRLEREWEDEHRERGERRTNRREKRQERE